MDRESICAYIEEYSAKNCYNIKIYTFDSGEALLAALLEESLRIIFLDIHLPGMSGVETAKKIRERDQDCVIVFITVSSDYALDGYDVSAVSYIVKPIEAKKIEKAFAMCRNVFEENSRYIEIMADYRNIQVPINKILYAEVYGKTTLLHFSSKVIKTYLPINKLETMLGCPPFLRCHRCFIVNLNFVEDMRTQDFLLKNGDIIPIRKNGRSEIKLAMARFMCSI